MDKASRVGHVDLTFNDCSQYLEDLTSHLACFTHGELEKKHTDIAINRIRLCLLLLMTVVGMTADKRLG